MGSQGICVKGLDECKSVGQGAFRSTKPMKLLAILFWATLAAYALATFLDPEFPGILEILNNF